MGAGAEAGPGGGVGATPRGVFERFTDRARRAVVLAQEEARQLGHNFVGPEHLLLGLIRKSEGVAVEVLGAPDVDPPGSASERSLS